MLLVGSGSRRALGALLVATGVVLGGVGAVPAHAVAPTTSPVPVSPLTDAVVTSDPVFTWDTVPGADRYRFQLSTTSAFATPLLYDVVTYGKHATAPTALPSGQLYWHVAAMDAAGAAGPYSATVQFTRGALAGPSLLSPTDSASLTYPTTPPVLVWSPLAGAKTYTVDVDDNDTFTSPVTTTTSNSQLALTEPPALGTPQFWRVKATLGTGATTGYSATRSFSAAWSDAPALTAPSNGQSVQEIRLAWSPVAGAKTYEVQVSPNGDFQNNLVALGNEALVVTGTQYAPKNELQPQAYFWRVRPKDDATSVHPGAWSSTGTFTLAVAPAPTSLVPGADVTTLTTPPTLSQPALSWRGSPRASYYELNIGTDQSFSPNTFDSCTTFHTTFTPFIEATFGTPVTPPGGAACDQHFGASRYYWRVRGVEQLASGSTTYNGLWSATMSFFAPAGVPQTHPVSSSTAPVLEWDPVPGYDKYRVTLQKSGSATLFKFDTYASTLTPTASNATSAPVIAGDYTWVVQTMDGSDKLGPFSATGSFTVVAPTTVGTLDTTSPDGESSYDMPSLTWSARQTGGYYTVYYRSVGSTIWIPLAGSTKIHYAAYTSTAEPLPADDYEWYVEARDSTGGFIADSDTGTFSITQIDAATYNGPTDCITTPACTPLRDTPKLSWDTVPHARTYLVHIATDPAFANEYRVYSTQNNSITFRESLPDNQAGQSYYWFVQPCKSDSVCGPFQDGNLASREQSFRKATAGVVLNAPADGATVGDDPHLSWTDYFATNSETTDGSGAKAYRLQVATDLAFTNVVDDVTLDATTYTPFTKEYGDGTYYWHVQALDGAGQALTYSATRSFVKSSLVPSLNAVGAITTPLPTLTWGALPYVGGYQVEVFTGVTTNGAPTLTQSTKLPAFTPSSPLAKGTYTWRVAKLDPSGNRGPWSTAGTFEVTLPAPELLTPASNAALAGNDVVFSWTMPAGASAFRFESSLSPAFTTVFESQILSGTSWATPKRYQDATPIYWRVRALDGSSNVLSTSLTGTFTKDGSAPIITAVTPTADVPLSGPITVAFSEPVNGVSSSSLRLKVKTTAVVIAATVTSSADRGSATVTPSAPLVPGQTYVVEATGEITDDLDNALAPVSFDRRALKAVENGASPIVELWDSDSSASASGGAYAVSRTPGSTITFTFSGTSASVLGTKAASGGYADIYVDGVRKVANASFYRSTTAFKQTVYAVAGLAAGTHTLQVRALGTHPAGSSSNNVMVDALVSGATTLQESSARQAFVRVGYAAATGGTFSREAFDGSGDAGGKPEFRMTFVGTGVDWIAIRQVTGGQAKVYVDNVLKGTADLYAAANGKATAWSVSGLTNGTHTLRVIGAGTRNASAKGYDLNVDQLLVK